MAETREFRKIELGAPSPTGKPTIKVTWYVGDEWESRPSGDIFGGNIEGYEPVYLSKAFIVRQQGDDVIAHLFEDVSLAKDTAEIDRILERYDCAEVRQKVG